MHDGIITVLPRAMIIQTAGGLLVIVYRKRGSEITLVGVATLDEGN